MKKIALDIIALSHSVTQSNNYAVVLGEQGGKRKLPIVIGGFEAQAIAVALEHMAPNRPLTHDLFKNVMSTFDVDVVEVIISDLIDGIFHAQLVCAREREVYSIDSRTSDALALAVRFGCPVFTYDFILESAGVILDEEGRVASDDSDDDATLDDLGLEDREMKKVSIEDLRDKLQIALDKEDYEKAAEIRDELNRRRGSES